MCAYMYIHVCDVTVVSNSGLLHTYMYVCILTILTTCIIMLKEWKNVQKICLCMHVCMYVCMHVQHQLWQLLMHKITK
jgi:hypothetical protein